MMERIAVFLASSNNTTSLFSPNCGAVSIIIKNLIDSNEQKPQCQLTIYCFSDEYLVSQQKKYKYTDIIGINNNWLIRFLDKICYFMVRRFKRVKSISFHNIFSLIHFISVSAKLLKTHKYDKVVLENNVTLSWIIKKSHYSGKYYYHLHNIPRTNAKCQAVFDQCCGYLCVSSFVAKSITSKDSKIGVIPKERTMVLMNCIDSNLFKPILSFEENIQIRKKLGLSSSDRVILFVGRLTKEKGIYELLKALQRIQDKKLKLLIIGSIAHGNNGKDSFYNIIKSEAGKISDRVIFTGYISQKVLPIYYNICDVAVLPSVWDEPAGLTMVESVCCGLPLITTNSGGIPEYVGGKAIILDKNNDLIDELSTVLLQIKNKKYPINRDEKFASKFSVSKYSEHFIRRLNQ